VAPSESAASPGGGSAGAPRGGSNAELALQRERYERAGQGHVFAFADRLEPLARAALVRQADQFDPAAVGAAFASARARSAQRERLEPPDVVLLPERGGDAALRERARARGEALLAEGEVAVLIVAGGQGTRLGLPGPKGAFPLGPVTSRTLFAQQAQKLHAARRRSGRPLPWLVMTSEATDAATRDLFEAERCFGLPPDDVRFFAQGALPNVDFDGRILLAARDRIAASPDGHGGVFAALARSGLLDWLDARGVRRLSYSQVDNPLVPLADAVFLGVHELAGAEMSAKVLRKLRPDERLGTVGRRGDRVHVVEYTEIDPWHRDQRGRGGELLFWAGSIAIHVLNVDFARRVAGDAERLLPCHLSAKPIPSIDPSGGPLVPDAPNGYKLERFVFDALPAAGRAELLEVRRADEYSPIKNRTGPESPRTARESLVACYHRWLEDAAVEGVPRDAWIEIDQSRVDGPDDLRAAGTRRVGPETDWIRFGSRETT
jgi:UDP-N-acetylglucosamine/UDP-N-acetylgalactosamine diphosphorylase